MAARSARGSGTGTNRLYETLDRHVRRPSREHSVAIRELHQDGCLTECMLGAPNADVLHVK
jgi:hypothetical protein